MNYSEAPLVATGIEEFISRDTGRLVIAQKAGVVSFVSANKIKIKEDDGKEREYVLINFARTNSFNVFHQRPIINIGDKVKKARL